LEVGNFLRQVPRRSRLDTIYVLKNIQKGASMKINDLSSGELDQYVKFLAGLVPLR